jgi:nicotinamidase/pyrazinamidase
MLALIAVDVQNDFCEGGSLAVEGGSEVARAVTSRLNEGGYEHAVATRDHHIDPGEHFSTHPDFTHSWPPHCVVGTNGVALHPHFDTTRIEAVFDKGEYAAAYSGFEAMCEGEPLADWLRDRGVDTVEVFGIATDYCVRATALDALRAGFETIVLADAVAAVELEPGDGSRALAEVRAAGGALDRVHLLRGEAQLEPLLAVKAERLRAICADAGRERLVVGLSGGIDSAVAMALAARALGPERILAVRLPSRHTEQRHLDDAAAAATAAGLPEQNLLTVPIEPILAGVLEARPSMAASDIRLGNASARARMVVLYDLAQELQALVLGTENRSESLLGYFTRFGDAASDVEPIHDLWKTEVRTVARLLGQPQVLLDKEPTAGLWGGQTDEDELGFSYEQGDRAMAALYDLGLDVEAAAARSGVPPAVVARVKARVEAVAWKHHVPHHA